MNDSDDYSCDACMLTLTRPGLRERVEDDHHTFSDTGIILTESTASVDSTVEGTTLMAICKLAAAGQTSSSPSTITGMPNAQTPKGSCLTEE